MQGDKRRYYRFRYASRFIIESDGLMLGYDPGLIDYLQGHDVLIRIAVKGHDEETFEKVTGAKGEYQKYQVKAIKELRSNGIDVSMAYMDNFVDPDLLPLDEDFDVESFSYYQGTRSRMIKRGLETRIKPSQHYARIKACGRLLG